MACATRSEKSDDPIGKQAILRLEHAVDRVFGVAANPLRQLGALGFLAFWIVAASGAYLYVFYETSAARAYPSIAELALDQPLLGGLLRSVHRYASDAFVVLALAHMAREWAHGRYRRFRWFTWVSGVPLLWLAIGCGVIGFWLVWDTLAAWTAAVLLEWFAWLPGVGAASVRNAVVADGVTDRLFSLLIFLHIGLSLIVLLMMWVHVQRLTRAVTRPRRAAGAALAGALLVVGILAPAPLHPPADLGRADGVFAIDWFYLGILPLAEASPAGTWAVLAATTLALLALPLANRGRAVIVARVDPANCNGCSRCFADCPYAAITMRAHTDPARRHGLAQVDPRLCAGCGICTGSCPSATPFRSGESLVSGIDMPQRSIERLRDALDAALSRSPAPPDVIVFGCERAAAGMPDASAALRAPVIGLLCTGQMPPSFIEYALRQGAGGVVVAPCAAGDCEYRFGDQWTVARIDADREPHLRERVDRRRIAVLAASAGELASLALAVDAFRRRLQSLEHRDHGAIALAASGAGAATPAAPAVNSDGLRT